MASLVAAVWLGARRRPGRAPDSAIALSEIVTPGAALIATLDVEELRRHPEAEGVLERWVTRDTALERCALDVLRHAARVSLVVAAADQGATGPSDVAVVAEGPLEAKGVLACAEKLVKKRGGHPLPGSAGVFRTLWDGAGPGRLAVRDGGPLILSGGDYFQDLLGRASGTIPVDEGVREKLHAALRRRLGPAPFLMTWVPERGWLAGWLGDPELEHSALSETRVLGLTARPGPSVELLLLLGAEGEPGAQRIADFVEEARSHPGALSTLLGPDLSHELSVRRDRDAVLLKLSLPASRLFDLVEEKTRIKSP